MNGHKIVNQNSMHFLTFTVVGWIDVLTRKDYKEIVVESFRYYIENKGLNVHAYVIMSNHLHVIVSSLDGHNLSDIVGDFKKHTSKSINKSILENQKRVEANGCLNCLNIMLSTIKIIPYVIYNVPLNSTVIFLQV